MESTSVLMDYSDTFKEIERLLPKCFAVHKKFYAEEELSRLFEFYKMILSKNYPTIEEICLDMHFYMRISKYNLKRNQGKEKLDNVITFVCSCISKKLEKEKTEEKAEMRRDYSIKFTPKSESLEPPSLEQKATLSSLSEIFKLEKLKNLQNLKKIKLMECSSNSSFSSVNLLKNKKDRNIKRTNNDACKFRIKFWLQDGFYKIKNDSFLEHNHAPGSEENFFSVEDFTIKSRNIKFSLETINYIINEIIKIGLKFQNKNKNLKFDTKLKIELISKIREDVWNKNHNKFISNNCNKSDNTSINKRFKTNFLKKLTYFIKTLIYEYKNENLWLLNSNYQTSRTTNDIFYNKWKIYDHLYRFVMKKGANYLRQDSLHILIFELNKNGLESNKENLEDYIQQILIEKIASAY